MQQLCIEFETSRFADSRMLLAGRFEPQGKGFSGARIQYLMWKPNIHHPDTMTNMRGFL